MQKSFLFGNAVNRSKVPGERDADALIIRCGVESLSPENLERINKFGLRPEPARERENRHWVWTVRKWVSFCNRGVNRPKVLAYKLTRYILVGRMPAK